MRPLGVLVCITLLGAPVLDARHDTLGCATTQDTAAEILFLHRQATRKRAFPRAAAPAASNNRDIGNVAIIEATPGVVETLNQFNLDGSTLTFTPISSAATAYRYAVSGLGYDPTAASQGSPVLALGDDDSRLISLPFAFPFFGATYRQIYLNSDGNLTFTAGDSASSGRSVGRMTGGVPRISPLFDDLDPSQPSASVRFFADSSHVVFSWVSVPEYAQYGLGAPVTFQARLYLDGRIQFSYQGVSPSSAVVGIAPGAGRNGTAFVSFLHDPSTDQAGAIIERFGNTQDIDIVYAAQKFYETHEDAYDYLVIYNNLDIQAAAGAVAYESTVRTSGTGYAVPASDHGADYGSPARLHSVLNMGPLSNYPRDPTAIVPLRASSMDTPLTILGHETGHLFLAFASVPDPTTATAQPMIGWGGSHWSFVFNSEASLDEGEQITDRGANASPRFVTSAVTQGYSPLDRYLMGFSPASDVPPTFYVKGYDPRVVTPLAHPALAVSFNGTPVPVTAADIAQSLGRRTPDSTVAQRHYRFGFILVVAPGSLDPAVASSVQQVESYRQQFPAAYQRFSTGLAAAETTFNHSLRLSLSPAAGVVNGVATTATLTLNTAPKTDLLMGIATTNGFAQAPANITVPAGAKTATFTVSGVKPGVEELTATPADPSYETAFARIQVAGAAQLTLRTVAGDNQPAPPSGPLAAPIVVSLTDVNGLVYAGVRITASASTGGSTSPALAVTDATGRASFQWTPGSAPVNTLTLAVESAPGVTLRLNAGSAAPVIGAVVNAASSVPGMAAGSIDTLYGLNLGDATVTLNGATLPQLYRGEKQINFYVPAGTALGPGTLIVTNAAGIAATTGVTVTATDPGIFSSGVVHAGTSVSADSTPVTAGDYIEIYCTGLGPTRASASGLNPTAVTPTIYIGSTALYPAFSGLAPGFTGLYQIDVQIPAGLAPGRQPLVITSGQTYSNQTNITVQ
jgi:uncharacterized protein (TIGR03437 family)